MTKEELHEALYNKCDKEFDLFIDEVNEAYINKSNGKYPLEHGDEYLSEYSFKHSTLGDILMAIEEIDLSEEQYKSLLDKSDSLNTIYEKWLKTESGYMDSIRDCIRSVVTEEMENEKSENQLNERIFDNLDFKLGMNNQSDLSGSKISVLVVEPGKEPYTKEISDSLESLQSEVGGYIETVYPFDEPVAIICNEEGKIQGLPLNRALRDDDGNMFDIVAGTMLIVGLGDENFDSLSPELSKQFSELFKEPESFFFYKDELMAIKDNEKHLIPVYYEGSNYANENRELEIYRLSFKTNIACKKDIEKLILDNYSDNTLKSENVYNQIVEKYGSERVNMVLANTCNHKDWDARISDANKEWAKAIPVPTGKSGYGDDMTVNYICEKPHIGLVDLVVRQARLAYEKEHTKEKTSLLGRVAEAKEKIAPPSSNKSKKKEHSID